jgi:site-specific recombinase XerD
MGATAYFVLPKMLDRTQEGPLGPYVEDFAALLQQQGYSKLWGRQMILVIAHFSRWLYEHSLGDRDVDAAQLERFLAHRKRNGRVGRDDSAALQKMLDLLCKKRVVHSADLPSIVSARERACDGFRRYLVQQCGVSTGTLRCYLPFIWKFLAERFGDGPVTFKEMVAKDVTGFIQRHAQDQSPSRAQCLGSALRAFLRHLRHDGEIAIDLASCVPAVANWSLSALPKSLNPVQVEQVLAHCDRKTTVGRRDYAILMLLARLGLRAGEVAALRLNDINWEEGHITVRSKGGRWTQLPLPADVGRAMSEYLTAGRPSCTDRQVFIREHAPRTGFSDSATVSRLVKRALIRAGVDSPRKGAHLFRHTLASEMLKHGASLREIGELLGHRSPDTTRIYAKVDVVALQSLALPWPGGV